MKTDEELLNLALELFEMIEHGDFSNGVEEYGVDEGAFRAYEFLKEKAEEIIQITENSFETRLEEIEKRLKFYTKNI